ncbi:MAG TPA: ABC transporter substrate-binding protein [Candidatus Binatia bacterium]|jgi:putative ABC transport system substrate-binding protein
MKRTGSFLALVLLVFLGPDRVRAEKIYRIGAAVANDQSIPAIEGFQKKMAELGYIDGKNVKYDVYNAHADGREIKHIAQKLVQSRLDLIVTSSTSATEPVARASAGTKMPVVFLSAGNPLAVVKSYASSGNNLTGITTAAIDLAPKRMEILKELAPGIKKLIALNNPHATNYRENLTATRAAAQKLSLKLVEVDIATPEELILWAKNHLTRQLGDAVFYPPDGLVLEAIKEAVPYIIKERLPSVSFTVARAKEGALAAYGPDFAALGEQGALLVDKIFKGAKPESLPIEQPVKLKFVLNMKTAKAIGLKIPKEILLRADEVIE